MTENMQESPEMEKAEFTELDWITLKTDIHSAELEVQESSSDKFKRKFKENPFVPIGCGLTATALCYGLYSFSKGRTRQSQHMMRWRIAAQGFTVAALMFGIAKSSLKW